MSDLDSEISFEIFVSPSNDFEFSFCKDFVIVAPLPPFKTRIIRWNCQTHYFIYQSEPQENDTITTSALLNINVYHKK